MTLINRFIQVSIAALALSSQLAGAQGFDWAPDFPEGSSIPVLAAPDQNGNIQTLETLTGEKGIILLFSRSFDWCPFCKAQLTDIVAVQQQIESTGFNMVAMTYDSVDALKLAEEDFSVGFIMLHDEAVKHIDAFGIRNTDPEPDSFAYGIPQPGIMLINPSGTILRKFAEEGYRERPDFTFVIDAASEL